MSPLGVNMILSWNDPVVITTVVSFLAALIAYLKAHTTEQKVNDNTKEIAVQNTRINGELDLRVEQAVTKAINARIGATPHTTETTSAK